MSPETFLAEAEGVGLALPRGSASILPSCFPTRHGLGVAWTGVEDHPPEPPGLDSVTAPSASTARFRSVRWP